jgi:hypothetical protein
MNVVGLGALIGPSIGTALWRSTHRRLLPQIDAKDREFFRRVAKNRVDASLQSPAQPVPDYYGMQLYLQASFVLTEIQERKSGRYISIDRFVKTVFVVFTY